MPLFDAYLMVDWSAAAVPRRGRDSIWFALLQRGPRGLRRTQLVNPATRAAAAAMLADRLMQLRATGRRILVGFDFPFGYPVGTAARLRLADPPWRFMWQAIADRIEDRVDNANNRFDVAEDLNTRLSGGPYPFWGNVREETRPALLRRGRRRPDPADLAEWRLCDRRGKTTSSVWQLAGAGSVGSQVLTGLPRVWALRTDPRFAMESAVWPFETGLRHDPEPRIVFAEVYPSIVAPRMIPGKPKDAAQVVTVARHLAAFDDADRLPEMFAGDPTLTPDERDAVVREEAWILGVTDRVAA